MLTINGHKYQGADYITLLKEGLSRVGAVPARASEKMQGGLLCDIGLYISEDAAYASDLIIDWYREHYPHRCKMWESCFKNSEALQASLKRTREMSRIYQQGDVNYISLKEIEPFRSEVTAENECLYDALIVKGISDEDYLALLNYERDR